MVNEQLDVEHLFTLDLQVAEGVKVLKDGPHGTVSYTHLTLPTKA